MAVTAKKITLWRKEIDNVPGALAGTLQPLSENGAELQVVMGYRHPGHEAKATVEMYPVAGKKLTRAAGAAGLGATSIPTLLVEGDDKPGLGHAITKAVADAGININFLVAQVIGKKFSAVIGFDDEADAKKASALVKKAAQRKK
jgi:hypothetical protein